jgi:hypothetical protein
MAIGCNGTQLQSTIAFNGVEINAVEVITGFFRRDRKLGAINQAFQSLCIDAE